MPNHIGLQHRIAITIDGSDGVRMDSHIVQEGLEHKAIRMVLDRPIVCEFLSLIHGLMSQEE